MRHTALQCKVIPLMTYRKIKTNRVTVFLYFLQYDLLKAFAKLFTRIILLHFKPTDDQAGKPVQFAGTLQVPEHPVDTVKIFTGIFNEQDFIIRIYIEN